MARRTKAQIKKQKQQRIVVALASLLLLAVLAALFLAVPGLEDKLYTLFGIRETVVVPNGDFTGTTRLHFIDVGQGDAVLLEQDGEFALLDAGIPETKDSLVAYLEGAGVTSLRYLIMTHPHADHIGGMQAVAERFPVQQVLLPDFSKAPLPTSNVFLDLLQCFTDLAIPAATAAEGQVYALGSGSITILHDGLETASNLNLLSLCIAFEADGLRFIATGDAEKQNEAALVAGGVALRADVFHAGHHGSNTSNTQDLLYAIRPALVVVSCGQDNSYGHPHSDALASFTAVGSGVLRTDRRGSIVVGPGAEGLVYACEREEA